MGIFPIIHVIVAVLLALCILLQHRASGLSSTFGGGGVTYVQRRGAEKLLFQATVVLGFAFFGLAILQWYV
jgi:protein translocase SecG subunit